MQDDKTISPVTSERLDEIEAYASAASDALVVAVRALLDSLGEYGRQTLAVNREWSSGITVVENALLKYRRGLRRDVPDLCATIRETWAEVNRLQQKVYALEEVYDESKAEIKRLRSVLRDATESGVLLSGLRAEGWEVVCHNDYRLDGVAHTFWSFSRGGVEYVKGEGLTDAKALRQVREQLTARGL